MVLITAPEPNGVSLEPVLLNQGDCMRLRMVVEDPELDPSGRTFGILSNITVSGRIVGIRRIQQRRSQQTLAWYGGIITLVTSGISTVSMLPRLAWLQAGSSFAVTGFQVALASLDLVLLGSSLTKQRKTLHSLRMWEQQRGGHTSIHHDKYPSTTTRLGQASYASGRVKAA